MKNGAAYPVRAVSISQMIRRFFHVHKWVVTRLNKSGMPIERHCVCAQFQHRLRRDLASLEGETWRTGRHPHQIG